ncbi:MAG: hypothetical protein U1E99_08835 [Agitococcus sp.]
MSKHISDVLSPLLLKTAVAAEQVRAQSLKSVISSRESDDLIMLGIGGLPHYSLYG